MSGNVKKKSERKADDVKTNAPNVEEGERFYNVDEVEEVKEVKEDVSDKAEEVVNPFNSNDFHYFEIFVLKAAIERVLDQCSNRTKIVMFDNIDICQAAIDKIKKLDYDPKGFDQYTEELNQLYLPSCISHEGRVVYFGENNVQTYRPDLGQAVIKRELYENNQAAHTAILSKLERESKVIRDKFAFVIEEKERIKSEYLKFLNLKVENINLVKVKVEDIPDMNYEGSSQHFKIMLKSIIER